MQNKSIITAWESIRLDENSRNTILAAIIKANECNSEKNTCGNLFHKSARKLAAVGIVGLLAGSLIAYASLDSSGSLLVSQGIDTGREANVQFELKEDILIPIEAIHGEVSEAGSKIEQQFRDYNLFSSVAPEEFVQDFQTIEQAGKYIGYDPLHFPEIEPEPESIRVTAVGSPDGTINEIRMSAYYACENGLMAYSNLYLFTEYYSGKPGTGYTGGSDAYKGATFTGETCVCNDRMFYCVQSTPYLNDWLVKLVFWQENQVVYELVVRYQPEKEKEAKELTENWMKAF